ncbi:hypothetical protein Hanom_Chr13g01232291 [Helianthus anomalus]
MNQELNQRIPHFTPKSKILCRVVHTQLLAEQDTDEVHAQITLLQEADVAAMKKVKDLGNVCMEQAAKIEKLNNLVRFLFTNMQD